MLLHTRHTSMAFASYISRNASQQSFECSSGGDWSRRPNLSQVICKYKTDGSAVGNLCLSGHCGTCSSHRRPRVRGYRCPVTVSSFRFPTRSLLSFIYFSFVLKLLKLSMKFSDSGAFSGSFRRFWICSVYQ